MPELGSTVPTQITLYETRQVQVFLEERGVHLEREPLSTLSDQLGLITRPPDNDRRPRRWTMAQIEFIALAARLLKMRGADAIAALASGDSDQIGRYADEVQACIEQLIERAPAAHDASIAAIHYLIVHAPRRADPIGATGTASNRRGRSLPPGKAHRATEGVSA